VTAATEERPDGPFDERPPRVGPWGLLQAAAFLCAPPVLVALLRPRVWPLELLNHFHVVYAAALLPLALAFALGRRWRGALVCAALAAVPLAALAPAWSGAREPAGEAPRLRVALLNILSSNERHDAVLDLLRSERPDLVVLQEVTLAWQRELLALQGLYPHRHLEPREDNFGIAVFSRAPLESVETRFLGSAQVPSIVARLRLGPELVTVVATHPIPPVTPGMLALRDGQLAEVRELALAAEGPLLVVGDLNTSPWSPVFADLLDGTGLRDARHGRGLLASWPDTLPVPVVPIDHVLVSEKLAVEGARTGPDVGSDHRPLLVELRLRSEPTAAGH
jgi:endonuclease/exonuclease/phosphatase (EEP) superfamily protein YafD